MGWRRCVGDSLGELSVRLAEWLDIGTPVVEDARRHRRGAQLWMPRSCRSDLACRETVRQLRRWEHALRDDPGPRFWGECGWTVRQAEQHALVLGATRAGKTQILSRVLRSAIALGWRCVIVDAKGEYTRWLMGEKPSLTALLAPWDRRSPVWLLSEDLRTRGDADDTARTLLPDRVEGHEPFWVRAARGVVKGILLHEMAAGRPWGWDAVWRWVMRGRGYVVSQFVRAAETAPIAEEIAQIDGKQSTSSADVWKTIVTYLEPLADLAAAWPMPASLPEYANAWSAQRWLRGFYAPVLVLPLPTRFGVLAETTVRLALEALARAILSLPDDPARKILFVLDEFASLGEMEAVGKLLRQASAKGVGVLIGVQDLGSVRAAWGRDGAESILSACGTLFALRLGDPSLAEYAARALAGRREIEERLQTASRQTGGARDSTSTSEHVRIDDEWVVRPEELIGLPNMRAYVRAAGWPQIVSLGWEPELLPQRAPAVEEAEWVTRPLTMRQRFGQPEKLDDGATGTRPSGASRGREAGDDPSSELRFGWT